MSKKEAPIHHLQQFLPPNTYEAVLQYLQFYKVHLTVARERKSILGDYRHRTHFTNHRISVNGSLNKFSFLITLLHELAHLLTFEQFGNKVQAHGREWKSVYAKLLEQFIQNKIFPADIEKELLDSLRNPAASSCAEDGLIRVLRKYDDPKDNHRLVEEIPLHGLFRCSDGRVFKKGEKIRKRFKCIEVRTGKLFLFSPVYEVELVGGS
jgi:SprT protein